MKLLIHLILVLISVLAFSCSVEDAPPPQGLVLEAWINSEGYPVAVLTKPYYPSQHSSDINDMVVRWGKVTISDGNDTVILTGGPSGSFFPPYRYYTYKMKGSPGCQYTITAQYEGITVESTATMLQPTPIDSVVIKAVEANDSIRTAELYFTAPDDTPAYYYITIIKNNNKVVSQPGVGVLSTTEALVAGERIAINIQNHKSSIYDEHPNLTVGETLEISLCRVEKSIYDYWRMYDNYVLFGNSVFISNQSALPGNVKGGYGIFSVQAVSTMRVTIK